MDSTPRRQAQLDHAWGVARSPAGMGLLPSRAAAPCRGRHVVCARRCPSHSCAHARRCAREESLAGRWWRAGGTVLRRRTARRADHPHWLGHAWCGEAIAAASEHLGPENDSWKFSVGTFVLLVGTELGDGSGWHLRTL